MKLQSLTAYNRSDIQKRYVDHVLGSMDFMEIKDSLRDFLEIEKTLYSNKDLESEILNEVPELLLDNYEDFDEPALLTQNYKVTYEKVKDNY